MSTVTVSIGRRIGTGDNLPTLEWRRFRAEVEGAVRDAASIVYFAGLGGGVFEGVFEESATWVADVDPAAVPALDARLARYAAHYGQESIARTVGETALVPAATRKGVAA